MVSVSGPNQCEFLLEGKREENPTVAKLKEVSEVVIEESIDYDVRAAYQAKRWECWRPNSLDHLSDPRTSSIDQRESFERSPSCRQLPVIVFPDGSGK